MDNKTYAEDVNYWKTGQSSTDTWLARAISEIETVGGTVLGEGFINECLSGKASFMIAFELDGDNFKLLWPVLESKTGNNKAARIQAATALYHEVKAACVKLKFLGARAAFLPYWMLPNGYTPSETIGTLELPTLLGSKPVLTMEK